ncbi:hypothetical protein ACOKM5_05420 [Streptomyces sp. BH097]|uniref:hypothetical protein n=1 Tax=unclassified Streptomyces TaxID=2593676 RepID=UPI003BB56683
MTSPKETPPSDNRLSLQERWKKVDCVFMGIADIPWGLFAFVILLLCVTLHWLPTSEATPLVTASGLIGIGHGIHTGTKHLGAKRQG